MVNVIIVVVIALVVVVIVRNYIAKGGHSDCCGTDDTVRVKGPRDKNVANYPHTYTVEVNGMSCDNCAKRVTNAFNELDGAFAEVSLKDGIATVRTKEPHDTDELTRVVRNAGYGVGKIAQL